MDQSPSTLVPLSAYVRELRPRLPAEAFRPSHSRLALVPLLVGIITAATLAIALALVPWPIMLALSVLIGLCFAGLTFVGHEAMHGGIVRNRRLKHAVAWVGFLPFVIAPRLWAAWHDRVHHACANNPAEDPDVYPTLAEYHTNSRVRFFIDWFALGGRRWRGGLSLVLGFTVQALHMMVTARRRNFLDRRGHWLALGETALGVAVWATVAALVGFVPFLLVYVVPLLVANSVVMGFILTNHSLSPNAPINDPLVTGLSVTSARWVERATLRFGYHVEHHLFPSMSSRHAPKVRALLRTLWPDRYQSMPLREALLRLHRTSRVYKDANTLVDPRTGVEYATLGAPAP